MIVVIGASGDDTAGHHFLAEVGVGHDAQFAGRGDEERRDVLCAHQIGGFSHRSFWTAEHRRPRYEVADADRANLRQAVDRMAGADEPLAHGPSNEYGTGGLPRTSSAASRPISVTGRILVRSDGEGCRHTSQQRWVTKALSGLEDVHHLVLVA